MKTKQYQVAYLTPYNQVVTFPCHDINAHQDGVVLEFKIGKEEHLAVFKNDYVFVKFPNGLYTGGIRAGSIGQVEMFPGEKLPEKVDGCDVFGERSDAPGASLELLCASHAKTSYVKCLVGNGIPWNVIIIAVVSVVALFVVWFGVLSPMLDKAAPAQTNTGQVQPADDVPVIGGK